MGEAGPPEISATARFLKSESRSKINRLVQEWEMPTDSETIGTFGAVVAAVEAWAGSLLVRAATTVEAE